MWKKVDELSFDKIKSYLFTAAYHTMLDVIKKEKRISHFDNEREFEQSHETFYTGLNEILEEALGTLPEKQRTVVLLRDYEGYSYDEIAEITGLKSSQIKVYIFRARKALQLYLGSIEKVLG